MYVSFHGGAGEVKALDGLFHDACEADPRPWYQKLSRAIKSDNLRLRHAVAKDQGLVATHVTSFSDATLIKLAKRMGMPRGCVLVIDEKTKTIKGMGSFYPKFSNDDRQQRDTKIYSEGVDKISFHVKYSGSLGIVTLFEVGNQLCYTASSKNSCNVDKPPDRPAFPAMVHEVAAPYMTDKLLAQLKERGITSFCGEFFFVDDASHGYSYNASGFICTSMARIDDAGQVEYLSPQELGETCDAVGLPTDMPLVLTDRQKAYEFMSALVQYRNVMGLTLLERISKDIGVHTMRHHHRELIKGDIIEGFVIRRWKGDVELPAIKFKCWLYQMITQCVRKYMKGATGPGGGSNVLDYRRPLVPIRNAKGVIAPEYLKMVESAMKYWCPIAAGDTQMEGVCRWLLIEVAKMSKASDKPLEWRDEFKEAYWATLGRHVADKFLKMMVEADWDIRKLALDLPPKPKQVAPKFKPGDAVLVIPIGIPGIGKSAVLRTLAHAYGKAAWYTTQDDHKDAKGFFAKIKKGRETTAAQKKVLRLLIADRNNHRVFHRNDFDKNFGEECPRVYLNFVPEDDLSLFEIADIAVARQRARGAGHQNLRDPALGQKVIHRFVDEYEELDTVHPVIEVPVNASVEAKVALIAKALWDLHIVEDVPTDAQIAEGIAETRKFEASLGEAAEPALDCLVLDDRAVNTVQDICIRNRVAVRDDYSVTLATYNNKNDPDAVKATPEVFAELSTHVGAPVRATLLKLYRSKQCSVITLQIDIASTTPPLPLPKDTEYTMVVYTSGKDGVAKAVKKVLKDGDGIPIPAGKAAVIEGYISRRYVR